MRKTIREFIFKIGKMTIIGVVVSVAAIVALLLFLSSPLSDAAYYKVVDSDPDRGATTVAGDIFGDNFKTTRYLDQGWSEADSLWFYNITQGSNLLPYDFFIALEQKKSEKLFRSPENTNRYRFLPQKKTRSNPDALPVGMVADTYQGRKYMGFTCAACHSSQVNYKGVGIRIDGGPSASDGDQFQKDMSSSLEATLKDSAKRKRFVDRVLKIGNYRFAADVEKDLKTYTQRMLAYNFFNESYVKVPKDDEGDVKVAKVEASDAKVAKGDPCKDEDEKKCEPVPVPYGYARLDAFGRIYNRVLEHLINREALEDVLTKALPVEERKDLLAKMNPVLTSTDRDHVIERLRGKLNEKQMKAIREKIFNSPNAPVSYPFIWDIPQHDYVQWNGIGANAGVGPIGRNAGEVIGVFGTLDWAEKDGWTVASVLGGQGFGPTHISFKSSINVHNLRQIESRLETLQSPRWTDPAVKDVLPALDEDGVSRGAKVFSQNCASCHANINRTSSSRRVVAHMDKLSEIGTDKTMANNSVDYAGYSGILRNKYMKSSVGGILLDTRAPGAALVTSSTLNVVATPDPDKWFFTRAADWLVDLIGAFFSNEIKPSVKSGNYTPDTTAAPFESLRAYKARSLNGIWATAPYLHNGSVPTLYDLLLPAAYKEGDPEGMVYRPTEFQVGSRELDVKKVGFRHTGYKGFVFDTSKHSNSNAGHEYGTREMSDKERWDLVEYLKSL